jgi:hypothetical protein
MYSRCVKHMQCQCLWCHAQVLVTVTPGVLQKVRHLGAPLGEALGSPSMRGPQGPQRTPDIGLAADERRLGGAQIRQILRKGSGASQRMPWSHERYAWNRCLEDLGNVPAKDLQGWQKRPHRCLSTLTKPVPRLLLSLIIKNEEGIRSPTGPEPERLTPPVGTAPRGDEVAAPQDVLEICPRDNHRDEHISLYPWYIYCLIEYPWKAPCID